MRIVQADLDRLVLEGQATLAVTHREKSDREKSDRERSDLVLSAVIALLLVVPVAYAVLARSGQGLSCGFVALVLVTAGLLAGVLAPRDAPPSTRAFRLEISGREIWFDGRQVLRVELHDQRIDVDGVRYELEGRLSPPDLATIRSALDAAAEQRLFRQGEVPREITDLRDRAPR